MMRMERRIGIEASPERVFEILMDPRCLSRWVTIHEELRDAPDGNLRVGSEFSQRMKVAGRRFTVHWRVERVDPPSCAVWEGRGPLGTKAHVVYDLEPDGDGTTFNYTNEYVIPGGALGRIAGSAVSRAAAKDTERSLENLKRLLERRAG